MKTTYEPYHSSALVMKAIQLLFHCPSSAGQEEKIRCKSSWVQIEKGRLLIYYHHGQNRPALGKINLLPIKIGLDSEKQRQIKTTASTDSLPLLSRLNFHPSLLMPLLSHSTEQCREWGLWSAHSSFSLLLLPPHTFHSSSVGVFLRVHSFMNCSRAGSSMGCSMDICSGVWSTSSPPSSLT